MTPRPKAAKRRCALRLGLRQIKGLPAEAARRLVAARGGGYASLEALWRRAGLAAAMLEKLADADAFRSLGLDRRQALWAVKGLGPPPLPLFAAAPPEPSPQRPPSPTALPAMSLGAHVAADYATLGLSLKRHPLAFLRGDLEREGMIPAKALAGLRSGRRVSLAGLVLIRQRPATASGVIFMTIEDETGVANLVLWPGIFEAHRRIALGATLIGCTGRVQREGLVIHVVAERLADLTARLGRLSGRAAAARRLGAPPEIAVRSRDFR